MISATVVGNVGQDAELRFLQDGTAVLNISVASNEKRGRDKDDIVTWVRVAMFGKRAEALVQYVTKGTKIAVRGSLSMKEYQRRDGGNGASLELRADDLELLGSPRDGASREAPAQRQQPAPAARTQQRTPRDVPPPDDVGYGGESDDDIPF